MDVFISWSGETSKLVAETLRWWLPKVVQAVKPWLSFEDIDKGAEWAREIRTALESCNFGIICLSSNNLTRPWLHFESGALSKYVGDTHVCTYLFHVEKSQVGPPLGMFQATDSNDKEDTRKLVITLNKSLPIDHQIKPHDLNEIFDHWWDLLNEKLMQIDLPKEEITPARTLDEKMDEILGYMRTSSRTSSRSSSRSGARSLSGSTLGVSSGSASSVSSGSASGVSAYICPRCLSPQCKCNPVSLSLDDVDPDLKDLNSGQ